MGSKQPDPPRVDDDMALSVAYHYGYKAGYDRAMALAVSVIADAVRRPMGVVPESAERLVTQADLDSAEARRPRHQT